MAALVAEEVAMVAVVLLVAGNFGHVETKQYEVQSLVIHFVT